jgi:amidase
VVSAQEVVEAHVQRIEAVTGAVNAVVAFDAERSLTDARAADDALARGGAAPGRRALRPSWSSFSNDSY